ncbi:MAG: helix-turn-helix domain-containing protein [Chloroflexota bacterium]|nr:helix-turn-helix domain-containing protein [Chloroflexota bacterium]
MNAARCEADALRRLADMPFLDRLELAALTGWSRGAVYDSVAKLEERGMVEAVPHASPLVAPTRRHALTAAGVERLAELDGQSLEETLFLLPVSRQWRRGLLERLDAVAVIYRLASAVNQVYHPLVFRWYRAMPLDTALVLPDGRSVAVVRQGNSSDRTAFAKRLWRLGQLPPTSAVLMLLPDEVRLRQARRLAAALPGPVFLALGGAAACAGAGAAIWRTPSGPAPLDLQTALAHTGPPRSWPLRRPPQRAGLPDVLDADADCLLPSLLKPVEKRAVDLLADWPWLSPPHLGALLGVKRSRLSQVTRRLAELGLLVDVAVDGDRRLALSDRGLVMLARRDRTSVGDARKRWSARPLDPDAPLDWRNVAGTRTRQLLRNVEHTAAVHGFVAALCRQGRSRSREIVQLDPPRRASRYFRHDGKLRSVHPDAFGIVRRGESVWPFFLEWERRAVRPATMAARVAPYLRYYASPRPTDDHGNQPMVLVVFDDDIALTHFLEVAAREMERARVRVPLLASHRELVERAGPLGRAWIARSGDPPDYAFQPR